MNSNFEKYKISVVMPVYNAEKFLERSVKSVLGQTHKNIELILIDDGSEDNSINLCQAYKKSDDRVIFSSQENGGPSAARNKGMEYVSGDFVFFLDADDFLELDAFQNLLNFYENSNADLVLGNFQKLETNGQIVQQEAVFEIEGANLESESRELNKNEINEYIRHFFRYPSNHLISYCWARLYKTSIIKKYQIKANSEMRLFEDFVLNLEYLKHTQKLIFVNKPVYNYVMHNSHLSASMGILNSKRLLYDMGIFKEKVESYFGKYKNEYSELQIKKEIAHTLVHYLIIFFIRSCRDISGDNFEKIKTEFKSMLDSRIFSESIPLYNPSKGNSKLIPFLMKLKQIKLLILVCSKRAVKRYGKLKDQK